MMPIEVGPAVSDQHLILVDVADLLNSKESVDEKNYKGFHIERSYFEKTVDTKLLIILLEWNQKECQLEPRWKYCSRQDYYVHQLT